ncbi:hypothetical protein [Nonomuraea salmonea]|uniref:4Fe-4S Wbl-type domain-containing protein n=1 Tax=Nonomuraea salmonea TaxID=46181 RepID=A0ABV5P3Y8_9ACTN
MHVTRLPDRMAAVMLAQQLHIALEMAERVDDLGTIGTVRSALRMSLIVAGVPYDRVGAVIALAGLTRLPAAMQLVRTEPDGLADTEWEPPAACPACRSCVVVIGCYAVCRERKHVVAANGESWRVRDLAAAAAEPDKQQ